LKRATICSLKENTCENCNLDLVFPPQIPLTIVNNGNYSVSLTGYFQPLSIEEEQNLIQRKETKNINNEKFKKLNNLQNLVSNELTTSKIELPNKKSSNVENPTKEKIENQKKAKQIFKSSDDHSKKNDEKKEQSDEHKEKFGKSNSDKVKGKRVKDEKVAKNKKEKVKEEKAKEEKIKVKNLKKDKKHKKLKESKKEKPVWSQKNGVKYFDIQVGTGKKVKSGDFIKILYAAKNTYGKIVDSVIDHKKPFSFKFDKGEVIRGWDIGLKGIRIGGKRKLVVPAKLVTKNKVSGKEKMIYTIKVLES